MNHSDLKGSLELAFAYSTEINQYVEENAPWKMDIEIAEQREKLENILFILLSNLRKISLMLLPFFDLKMRELLTRIGFPYDDALSLSENLALDPSGFYIAEKGEPLYMRIAPKV
jgi:methionyl-tRNA synthetase